MRKRDIKVIASNLGWELEEVSEALQKLKKEQTIISNWDSYFKLCTDSSVPEERFTKVTNLIYPTLNRLNQDNLVSLICKWIYKPDPLFDVCAVFNLAYYKNAKGTLPHWLRALQVEKTFVIKFNKLLPGTFSLDPLQDRFSLCDLVIDRVVSGKEVNNEFSVHSTMIEVINKIGFMAFNLSVFRTRSFYYSSDPSKRRFARSLSKTLMSVYANSERSEELYWQYFLYVEKLKEAGYSLKHAYQKVAMDLHSSEYKAGTIKARYNEKKKEFKILKQYNPNYGIANVIADNRLGFWVSKYLSEYKKK